MSVNVRSLAAFKRWLATPGATVQITRHDQLTPDPEKRAKMLAPRAVEKVQTNAVRFAGGSWLPLDAAKDFRFEGDTVTVDLPTYTNGLKHPDPPFTKVIVYKLTEAS